jgi:uncharacterized paraquat-inducible protein A
MLEEPRLIACEACDLLHRRAALARGQVARCRRCGAELDQPPAGIADAALPLTLVLALASWKLVEEPALRLKARPTPAPAG